MKIYNRYLLLLALAASIINISLAASGQNDLNVFFIANTIAYLAITLLFVYFNPRARVVLNALGIILFGIFMVMIALNIVRVL